MTRSAATVAAEQLVLAGHALSAALATCDDLSDDDFADVAAATATGMRLAEGHAVAIAAEVVARSADLGVDGFARREGFRSPSALLVERYGLRRDTARRVLQVADLTHPTPSADGPVAAVLPVMGRALSDGRVSLDQAAAFIAGLDGSARRADPQHVAEADAGFVQLATDPDDPMPPEMLGKVARSIAARIDPQSLAPDHERMQAMRSLSLTQRDDGMYRISGLLPPEEASVVLQVIDAYASPRRHVRFDEELDGEVSGRDEHGPDDDRTLTQRRADGLGVICTAFAASGDAPTIGGDTPTLLITASHEALVSARAERAPEFVPGAVDAAMQLQLSESMARIEHTGDVVPVALASRLVCDAFVQVAFTSDDGEVLELGRSRRLFSKQQRRAVALRDKICQGPGCTMPARWSQVHHVLSWLEGGLTDSDNGIIACKRCHDEVHAGRLQVVPDPTGRRRWVIVRTATRRRRMTAA